MTGWVLVLHFSGEAPCVLGPLLAPERNAFWISKSSPWFFYAEYAQLNWDLTFFLFHVILLCLDNVTELLRGELAESGTKDHSWPRLRYTVCLTCVCACTCMWARGTRMYVCMYVYTYKSTTQKFPFGSLISLLSHAFGIHYPWASGASGPVPWLTVIWFIEIIWQGNRPWKTELWEAHLMNFLWFESGFILPCGGADTPEHTQPAWEPSEEWRLWQ